MKARTISQLLSVFVVVFGLAACAKKASNNQVRSNGARSDQTVNQNDAFGSCYASAQSAGLLYDDGTLSGSFRDRIGGLISATLDPANFGDISGDINSTTTGVDFRLRLVRNGSSVGANSSVQLVIYDSFVGSVDSANQTIKAFPITIVGGASGTINGNSFDATFSDGAGSIRVQGSLSGDKIRGTVSYVNSKHFSNGTPASGPLGAFSAPACSLQ